MFIFSTGLAPVWLFTYVNVVLGDEAEVRNESTMRIVLGQYHIIIYQELMNSHGEKERV